jgi:hypothetical protein
MAGSAGWAGCAKPSLALLTRRSSGCRLYEALPCTRAAGGWPRGRFTGAGAVVPGPAADDDRAETGSSDPRRASDHAMAHALERGAARAHRVYRALPPHRADLLPDQRQTYAAIHGHTCPWPIRACAATAAHVFDRARGMFSNKYDLSTDTRTRALKLALKADACGPACGRSGTRAWLRARPSVSRRVRGVPGLRADVARHADGATEDARMAPSDVANGVLARTVLDQRYARRPSEPRARQTA